MAALIVVLAVALAYVQVLGGTFIWDDRLLVLDAPLVDQSAPLMEYLRHPFWMGGAVPASDSYYRPLVTLSFSLDHRLHGSNAGGYHLTNLLFHLVNGLLLWALIRKTGVRALVAALMASAWALQPRLAEAVAWISGRTDVIATTFVLSSLLVWGRSWPRRLVAAGFLGLGLFAKESALAALPALAVAEWSLQPPAPRRQKLVALAVNLLPLLGGVCIAFSFRLRAVGVYVDEHALGLAGRSATVLDTIGTYALMLFDAFRPRAVIGRPGAVTPWLIVLGGAVLVAAVALVLRQRGPWRATTTVGLTLAAAAIFPVLHAVPIPLRTLAADRFLYLPTVGLAVAVAPYVDSMLALRRPAWLAATTLLVLLGWSTARRAAVWSDEVEFWVHSYLETPKTNSAAATELVGVFYRAGLYRDALTLSERERSYDDPSKRMARYNAAICLDRLGRSEEALALLLATHAEHRAPETEAQIAFLELKLGRWGQAEARLTTLVKANYEPARPLLRLLPKYRHAREELARTPEGDVAGRARLLTFLGDEPEAVTAWLHATNQRGVSSATLRSALLFLVQTGDRDALATVARRYIATQGALPPDLAQMVSVRLDEIDHVSAARPRVGLSG